MSKIPPSRLDRCKGCGADVQRSRTSAPDIYCLTCRRAGKAPSRAKHGSSSGRQYKSGCRCNLCKEANNERMRQYAARRRDDGNPIDYSRRETRTCEMCGATFTCRAWKPTRYCSRTCVGLSQRVNGERGSFSISRARRLAIYERDNWTCQICGEPTDPDDDPVGGDWYPTLDHIIPQSHMLFPDHSDSNLRTAHRWCNTVRGDLRCWTDKDLQGVA